MALRTYEMLLDTARTEEALPLPAQISDWRTGKEQRSSGETWRTAGCSATLKKSFPFPLKQRTLQGAKQTKKP